MQPGSFYRVLNIDPILCGLLLLLTTVGLLTLYSASAEDTDVVVRQGIHFLIAWLCLLAVAQMQLTWLMRWAPMFYLLGVLLLLAVLSFGDLSKGSRRWLDLGFVRFQPSELFKIVIPLMLSRYAASIVLPLKLWQLLLMLLLIGIPAFLIRMQPDLGTALLIVFAGLVVVFVTGLGWRLILLAVITAVAVTPLMWTLIDDYHRQRIITLIDPQSDPLGAGYHIIQSTIAIGSGGATGKGWLQSTQSRLEFLPERSTDFIFAVYCEEQGFIGALFLMVLYFLLIWRGLYIANNAATIFGRLFAASLVMSFFFYMMVNMGMVSGQLPVVGLPLPLLSLGGTSLVTIMMIFGLLMVVKNERRFM